MVFDTHVTNTDLHSLTIYKEAKLWGVDFINTGGGGTSCIIESSLSHIPLMEKGETADKGVKYWREGSYREKLD